MQDGIQKTNDLTDELMQMKNEKGNQLSDQELLVNIVGLIIGGYETTTLALMWAVHYLAKFPDVLKKLRVCPCDTYYNPRIISILILIFGILPW